MDSYRKGEAPKEIADLFGDEEKLPDGVVARVIIKTVLEETNETHVTHQLAASLSMNISSHQEAAAVLLALDGVANKFREEVTRRLAMLTMSGPDGAAEALDIIQGIMEGHRELREEGHHHHDRHNN